jgi:ribosomal protein S18 acetylase RimI-like enzyme
MQTIIHVLKEGSEMNAVRQLFLDYEKELDVDLSFQHFTEELANPLQKYGGPKGTIILAYWNDEPAGCIALTSMDQPGYCEMKRLYVRPEYRHHGLGIKLIEKLLDYAARQNYRVMRLDTLIKLQPAIRLYKSLGFYHIEPYYVNPLPEAVFMEKII